MLTPGLCRSTLRARNARGFEVELSYAPPIGAIGYAVARTLGFDPRLTIDQDLLVMKDLIEKQWAPAKQDHDLEYDAI